MKKIVQIIIWSAPLKERISNNTEKNYNRFLRLKLEHVRKKNHLKSCNDFLRNITKFKCGFKKTKQEKEKNAMPEGGG